MNGKKTQEKREPEVLVFQDVVRRRPPKKALQEKSRDDLPKQHGVAVYEKQKKHLEDNELNFRETMNEMRALTAKSLLSRDKKGEREVLMSLGAKPPPRDRIPYPRYLNGLKKRKKKATATSLNNLMSEEYSDSAGKKTNRKSHVVKGKGRWKDNVKSLNPYPKQIKGSLNSPLARKN